MPRRATPRKSSLLTGYKYEWRIGNIYENVESCLWSRKNGNTLFFNELAADPSMRTWGTLLARYRRT
jgi:hypothetical protein